MQICLVGLSHKTAPIEVREKVSLAPEAYPEFLHGISNAEPIHECAVLSTCNRTELYGLAQFYHDGVEVLESKLQEKARDANLDLEDRLYRLNGMDAVRHLFRVSSSLDSLVVGEPEILGQVKDAYRAAADESTAGLVMNKLFRQSLTVGKRVRSETEIGALAVSVSSVAVELAQKIFGSLEGKTALVIGAGETARQTLRHLEAAGISRITIANRTLENAEEAAKDFSAQAISLDALSEALPKADIVIGSATSPEPLLDRSDFETAVKARNGRTMFVIDIAVPRNVAADVGSAYNVYLYDIDDLEKVVQSNLSRRNREAEKAESIVEDELRRFASWWAGLDSVPTLIQLRSKMEGIRDEELRRYHSKFQHLAEKDRELIQQFGVTLINKVLHDPTTQIKKSGDSERAAAITASLRFLFRLDDLKESKGGVVSTKEPPQAQSPEQETASSPKDRPEPRLKESQG